MRVAILDSGVEATHPALNGLVLKDDLTLGEQNGDLRATAGEGCDLFGHGTAVCGIIRQLAPEAEIGSFRVLGENLRSRSAIIREGARQAIERGYHILNCSFGCSREDHVLFYKDWVDEAYIKGRHIVAACNNQDFARREWPGHFPTVITANFTSTQEPTQFYHRPGSLVEFLAAGEDMEVAWLGGGRKKVTGSSFACATITGLLARMLSANLALSPLEVKLSLQQLAIPWEQHLSRNTAPTAMEASA